MPGLTDDFVASAQPMSVDYEVFDTEIEVLSLRVYADGEKEFIVRSESQLPLTSMMESRPADCSVAEARLWAPRAIDAREAAYRKLFNGAHEQLGPEAMPAVELRDVDLRRTDAATPTPRRASLLADDIKGGFREMLLRALLGPYWYAGVREHRRTGHRYKKRS